MQWAVRIRDDEDVHRRGIAFAKQGPKPPSRNVGFRIAFRKEANTYSEDSQSTGFLKVLRNSGNLLSKPIFQAKIGELIGFIGSGQNERLGAQGARILNFLSVKIKVAPAVRAMNFAKQRMINQVSAFGSCRSDADIDFLPQQLVDHVRPAGDIDNQFGVRAF